MMENSITSTIAIENKWKVCVRCYTFNHASYIIDALNGFVMQQTNFPYVCCIVDDASTDGAQDIIREYINDEFAIYESGISYIKEMEYGTLIFARHKKNRNCFVSVLLLKENHYSSPILRPKKRGYISEWEHACKYEALCEGDDYWIDPLKLQKQVDFLESNPDYTLVCCHANFYDEEKQYFRPVSYRANGAFDVNFLITNNVVVTCTAMIRYSIYKSYQEEVKNRLRGLPFGDYQIWIYAAIKGKCMLQKDDMCVYRVGSTGVSHSKTMEQELKWMEGLFRMTDYFCNNYSFEEDAKKQAYFMLYRRFAYKSAILNNTNIYKRALDYYEKNGFRWTKHLMQLAHLFPYLKPFWSFLNMHNKIRLKGIRTFDSEIKWKES